MVFRMDFKKKNQADCQISNQLRVTCCLAPLMKNSWKKDKALVQSAIGDTNQRFKLLQKHQNISLKFFQPQPTSFQTRLHLK